MVKHLSTQKSFCFEQAVRSTGGEEFLPLKVPRTYMDGLYITHFTPAPFISSGVRVCNFFPFDVRGTYNMYVIRTGCSGTMYRFDSTLLLQISKIEVSLLLLFILFLFLFFLIFLIRLLLLPLPPKTNLASLQHHLRKCHCPLHPTCLPTSLPTLLTSLRTYLPYVSFHKTLS